MRRTLVTAIVVLLATVGLAVPAGAGSNRNFVAPMDGRQESPPVDTHATGVAKFKVSKDGSSVAFKVIVANIDNVFAAHLHCAPAGANGAVGATLFATTPPNLGRVNGILAQGTLTGPDGGNACGWSNVADMIAAMRDGDTYVNVHTSPGTPSGEIRGQVR